MQLKNWAIHGFVRKVGGRAGILNPPFHGDLNEGSHSGHKGSGLEWDFTGENLKDFVMISYYNDNMRKYKYFTNYSTLCKYNFHHET